MCERVRFRVRVWSILTEAETDCEEDEVKRARVSGPN